jgi:hypothetical protein
MLQIVRILCQVTVCLLLTLSPVYSGPGNSTTTSRATSRTCVPTPHAALRRQYAYSSGLPLPAAPPASSRDHRRPRHTRHATNPFLQGDEDAMIRRRTHNDVEEVMFDMLSLEMMSGEVREQSKRAAARAGDSRRNSSDSAGTPPWHCEMKRKWKTMKKGIYPRHIETGRCRQTRCFLDMYECRPRKYVVNVLKRSKRRCVPVPHTDSEETRYEEQWRWSKVRVTVGCECSYRHGVLDGRLRALLGL